MAKLLYIMALLISVSLAQRPGYAGSMPFGYPVMIATSTSTTASPALTVDNLGNRFGDSSLTTERLPLEANGNAELVRELQRLPVDQQPFWLLNWQALNEHRTHPQTWQMTDNLFIDLPSDMSDRSGGEEYPYRKMYLSK